jgi:hypothetical protein
MVQNSLQLKRPEQGRFFVISKAQIICTEFPGLDIVTGVEMLFATYVRTCRRASFAGFLPASGQCCPVYIVKSLAL